MGDHKDRKILWKSKGSPSTLCADPKTGLTITDAYTLVFITWLWELHCAPLLYSEMLRGIDHMGGHLSAEDKQEMEKAIRDYELTLQTNTVPSPWRLSQP